jgi:hypothetical protein
MFKEQGMDLIYGGLALVLWLAVWGLAQGCARLQGGRP